MKKRFLMALTFVLLLTILLCSCNENAIQEEPNEPKTETPVDGGDAHADVTTENKVSITDEEYFSDEYFTPIVRFSVASDVHVTDARYQTERAALVEMFNVAYRYADESTKYNSLDATVFVGDLANNGKVIEMTNFKGICDNCLRDGTTPIYMLGNHEFNTDSSTTRERFEMIFNTGCESHYVINGIHFISISPSTMDGTKRVSYSQETVDWLEAELAEAAKDSPTNPIFVFHHHGIKDTIYGTNSYFVSNLDEILSDYPQVVDFSGHTHYPMIDPRSIFQDDYTLLNTSTLSYYEMDIVGQIDNLVFPSDANGSYEFSKSNGNDAAEFYIVEVDATGATRIIGYDILGNRVLVTYQIKTPSDKSSFTYTSERAQNSEVPYFNSDAEIEITNITELAFDYTFPAALCKDNVQHYRVEIYDGDTLWSTKLILSDTFYYPTPGYFYKSYSGKAFNKTLNLKIYAVSSFGKESEPLTATVALLPSEGALTPDVLETVFLQNGNATNAAKDSNLYKIGSPSVTWNEAHGRYEATFNGSSAYSYTSISNAYSALEDSITLEFYGKIDSFNFNKTSFVDLLSNQQSGGCGLECKSNGTVCFIFNIGGSYKSVSAPIAAGEYFHAVATYDGTIAKLYINGTLVDSLKAPGVIRWPISNSSRTMVVGGDSTNSSTFAEAYFNGTISVANVYSYILDASQVTTAYQRAIGG